MEAEITSSENYGTGQKSQGQYISGKFSQQMSIMNDTQQEEPEDPEADVVDDEDDNTGNCQAADEGYSEEYYLQAPGDHQHQVCRMPKQGTDRDVAALLDAKTARHGEGGSSERTDNTLQDNGLNETDLHADKESH